MLEDDHPRCCTRDQLRTPGAPEVRVVLFRERAAGGARLGLTGDVSHAHRIPRMRTCDHGLQACRLRPDLGVAPPAPGSGSRSRPNAQ